MFCLTAVLRSDRKEVCHFQIRSLTPQQAAGNALAVRFKARTAEFTRSIGVLDFSHYSITPPLHYSRSLRLADGNAQS